MAGALPQRILKSALRVAMLLLVLAGIAYGWMSLSYDDEGPRVQANEGPAAVQDAMTSLQEFYQDKLRFPVAAELAGFKLQAEPHVHSARLDAGGVFTIVYSGRREIDGKSLRLIPVVGDHDVLHWRCELPDIAPRWWPDYCRPAPKP